jgi:hypothetical protein
MERLFRDLGGVLCLAAGMLQAFPCCEAAS